MNLEKYSIVPKDYKEKDPRPLLYLYPESINLVSFNKQIQTFSFYQTLEVAEDLARRQGFILLPWNCIHWQRAKAFGVDRKVKIGRKSFFLMKIQELTKNEKAKLMEYLEELNQEAI